VIPNRTAVNNNKIFFIVIVLSYYGFCANISL